MSYIELNLEFLFSMLLVRFLYLDGTINKDGTLIFCPRNFPAARLIKAALLLATREYSNSWVCKKTEGLWSTSYTSYNNEDIENSTTTSKSQNTKYSEE